MRIVIEIQGVQTESRFRGIGCYTLSLAQGIVRNRGKHEVFLVLSGLFPDTIEPIRAAFDGMLPQENIRVWHAPGPVLERHPGNDTRREVAELIREAFLASLQPDVIHVSSLFEGYVDDAVTSIGRLDQRTAIGVVLYDLIPLLNPEHYHKPNPRYEHRYFEQQLGSLKEQLAAQEMDAARRHALFGERFSEIDVQIAQANERTVLADTKTEQATARAMHAEAEAAYAKEQAHASGQQLQAILSSRSWRMTKPLRLMSKIARWFSRGARAWLALKPGSRPRRVASNVLVHLKVWVLNSPRVRAQAIRVVQRFPRLKARLLAVGSQSTSALPTVGKITPLVSDMPVAAARLYAKLLRAWPEQNKQDGQFNAHCR